LADWDKQTQALSWRCELLWASFKYIWSIWWREVLVAFVFYLPQNVQSERVLQKRLTGLKRERGNNWASKESDAFRNRHEIGGQVREEKAPFQYRSLDSSDEDIRLLQLYPGLKDGQIRVEVSHISLNDCPTVLGSVVRLGSRGRSYLIFVNGRR